MPSGLRANHLEEAVFCPSPILASTTIQSLHSVVNLLCSGSVPFPVIPHLCGASLTALRKKSGGLRPIAVGEVLRRLVSKCLLRVSILTAIRLLSPLQVGVGIPNRCEATVRAVNAIQADDLVPTRCKLTLQVDFSNVFNLIDHNHMFSEVCANLPSLSAWLQCCYGSQSFLHLGNYSILS